MGSESGLDVEFSPKRWLGRHVKTRGSNILGVIFLIPICWGFKRHNYNDVREVFTVLCSNNYKYVDKVTILRAFDAKLAAIADFCNHTNCNIPTL